MKIKPKPYQREGVEIIKNKFKFRALLGDEMGLGKSFQALWCVKWNPELYPAVVITLASVKRQWEFEAARIGIRATVCEGMKPKPMGMLGTGKLYIINYDILHKWVIWLKKAGVRTVIIDECQNFANGGTIRTRAGKRLVRKLTVKGNKAKGRPTVIYPKAKAVIALSGTALLNRPAELFPTLNMIDPKHYPAMRTFGWLYCGPTKDITGKWQYRGATRLKRLHRDLTEHVMLRRLKKDVLQDLPKQTRKVIAVELSKEDLAEYCYARDHFKKWLKANGFRGSAKQDAHIQLGHLLRLVGRLKQPHVFEWIDHFLEETDEKLVMFSQHRSIVAKFYERYKPMSVYVTGQVLGRKRQAAVDQFQTHKKTRIFFTNKAGNTGLNLTAANHVGFAEFFWRPGDHSQGAARIDRIGQDKPNWSYYFTTWGTIEENMAKLLQRKQKIINQTLDGKRGDIDMLSVHDELLKLLAA